jgi:hypothetical protein
VARKARGASGHVGGASGLAARDSGGGGWPVGQGGESREHARVGWVRWISHELPSAEERVDENYIFLCQIYFQLTEVKLFFVGWGEPTEIIFFTSAFSKTDESYFG